MRPRHAATLTALLLLALPGCAAPPSWEALVGVAGPTAAPASSRAPAAPAAPVAVDDTASERVALVATLRGDTRVLQSPGGGLLRVQDALTDEGTVQRLLVVEDRDAWLRVSLPGRPNGRAGWVRAGDVDLAATDWRLRVSLRERRLTVLRGGLPYGTHAVAVGTAATPTPTGTYYVTDLLAPPDPGGAYGPFAFGLSAYSDVITSFGDGGRGQIGLHGTDDPTSVGQAVSNGCLRLDNETIRRLAGQLPLGTPVEIVA